MRHYTPKHAARMKINKFESFYWIRTPIRPYNVVIFTYIVGNKVETLKISWVYP